MTLTRERGDILVQFNDHWPKEQGENLRSETPDKFLSELVLNQNNVKHYVEAQFFHPSDETVGLRVFQAIPGALGVPRTLCFGQGKGQADRAPE